MWLYMHDLWMCTAAKTEVTKRKGLKNLNITCFEGDVGLVKDGGMHAGIAVIEIQNELV